MTAFSSGRNVLTTSAQEPEQNREEGGERGQEGQGGKTERERERCRVKVCRDKRNPQRGEGTTGGSGEQEASSSHGPSPLGFWQRFSEFLDWRGLGRSNVDLCLSEPSLLNR